MWPFFRLLMDACNVFAMQTAQAHQQVVEKQVSSTLAHLTEPGNSHGVIPSLSLPLLSYCFFACITDCHNNSLIYSVIVECWLFGCTGVFVVIDSVYAISVKQPAFMAIITSFF